MSRVKASLVVAVLLAAGGLIAGMTLQRQAAPTRPAAPIVLVDTPEGRIRAALFAELQPVWLSNCRLQRFGERHDGGYLMCGNLLGEVEAGYSYGIGGYDQWGCDISTRLGVRVHQYDCFDLTQPACPRGDTVFHAECVAGEPFTDDDGRLFDTMQNQMARNGDIDNRLVVKIDVEGAEWDTFLQAPDELLDRFDQLAVELHGVDDELYVDVVRKLKRFFHVAHVHYNNHTCTEGLEPFPAWAVEVLFVNKRIGVPDPSRRVTLPHRLDTPSNPGLPDCQLDQR